MIKHIVLWKLAEEADGHDKKGNYQRIKEGLEALVGIVPGLREAEVGFNENGREYDAVLVSLFDSREALAAYDVHPAHQAVRQLVKKVRLARTSVDYELFP